ncbi:MAG: ROK family protein [Desulfitobacteriaceae bacterium]
MWIGIDLGGTTVRGILVNHAGQVLRRFEAPSGGTKEQALAGLNELLSSLYSSEVQGIGIGTPGFLNPHTGEVIKAGNIRGLAGFNLKHYIADTLLSMRLGSLGADFPNIVIDNDGNAAALGEMWRGADQGVKSLVMLTLGTGVGGGIICGGRLWRGHHFLGAELGHSVFEAGGRSCSCGLGGCLEQYISGTALAEEYRALIQNDVPRFPADPTAKGARIFFEAVKENDYRAVRLLDHFVQRLAWALASLGNIFNPELFILGGGISETAYLWWDKLNVLIQKLPQVPRIEKADLGSQAGLWGAVRLAQQGG